MSGTTMTDGQTQLITRCETFVAASNDAIAWINNSENAETVGAKKDTLERGLRRSIRRAAKLRTAAASNMAVSVFGPSQNGKSFLVSVLAQPENKPLMAAFNDPNGSLSYIREINPAGEGESTGLVTRFTMTRDATPDGFPIKLDMLSIGDMVQLLANAFFMDGDQSEDPPSADAIETHLSQFAKRTQPGSANGLSADDVWEIADYVDRNFKSSAYARALHGFWEEAARIAPTLPLGQLGAFFAPIWGGYAEFSEVYQRLINGLGKIGNARTVHARMDALVPRDSSIIDVAQLYLLTSDDTSLLELSLPDGRTVSLERSVVSALTAEFTLPMQDLPDEMFQEVDLLDFPGARNRFSKPLPIVIGDSENGGIGRLILRGKVAYLFDRYVEDQKINAMLLCIKDSNMETIDLPRLIDNWITLTQGGTPKMRAQAACILFFCLTFFDKHLVDSAAGADDSFRFEKRVDESLIKGFGSSAGWVAEWEPNKPFDNSFWIRNPNFPAEPFFEYDRTTDPWTETPNPAKADRLAELKDACLSVPLVQSHFQDPTTAWDAAMTAGDGGVSYLKANLRKVCRMQQKVDQIDLQIAALETSTDADLRNMYVSNDLDVRLAEKQAAAGRVLDGLIIALRKRSFAELIGRMMVDFDEVVDAMSHVPAHIRISSAAATGTSKLMLPGGRQAAAPRGETASDDDIETMTRAEFQTRTVIRKWIDRLDALKQDRNSERRYGLSADAMGELVSEMLAASRRCDLHAKTRKALEEVQFGLTLESQSRPAALVACEQLNRFVATFGLNDVPLAERPTIGPNPDAGLDKAVPVFAPPRSRGHVEDLPEIPRATLDETFQNWAFALDHAFTANATFVAGGQVNDTQNRALGDILKLLQRTPEVAI